MTGGATSQRLPDQRDTRRRDVVIAAGPTTSLRSGVPHPRRDEPLGLESLEREEFFLRIWPQTLLPPVIKYFFTSNRLIDAPREVQLL